MESGLRAHDLTIGYDNSPIMGEVNLELKPGKITVIAGPNGCGKSTLVKTFARQLGPLSGHVTLEGNDIRQWSHSEFAQRVSYVPQSTDLALSRSLSVEELVMLGRNPHQKWWSWSESAEDRIAVDRALAETEMSSLKDRRLANLSGGERQRAMIATALAQQPKFVLLDEPVSHLDFKHQSLIKEMKEREIGALVVLHDLNLMWRLADEIVLIKGHSKGAELNRIHRTGAPDEVLTKENVSTIFEVEIDINKMENGETYFHLLRALGSEEA